jgi:hypothetical protein
MNLPSLFRLSACAAAVAAALHPGAAQAGVRCNELALGSCLEARTSGLTQATIQWDDGTTTSLGPPGNTPFSTAHYGTAEYGSTTWLYSNAGLQSQLVTSPDYGGLGPAFQADYVVQTGQRAGAMAANWGYYTPGQASSAFLHGQTGALDPSLHIDGYGEADYGVNKASVSLTGQVIGSYTLDASNALNPGHTGTVQTQALGSGQAYWNDQVSFAAAAGVPAGSARSVSFSAQIDGSADAFGSYIFGLTLVDHAGHSQSVLSASAMAGSLSGTLQRQLSGTALVMPGETYTLYGDLIVYASTSGQGGAIAANEDFSHTARITGIALPQGLSASFASGSAKLGGVVTAVPEPAPAALLAAGLGVIGWLVRRRTGP